MAASISRLTKFRETVGLFLFQRLDKEKSVDCFQRWLCSTLAVLSVIQMINDISVTCHLYDRCVALIDFVHNITLGYIISNYFTLNKQVVFSKKAPWQSSALPLLCSDDARAPRNTVAVATCSLTILCFYCPVPYSTLLCLAEPDEQLLFRSDQQHVCGPNQLSFDFKCEGLFTTLGVRLDVK